MLNAWEKRRNKRCLTNNSDSGSCGIRVLVHDSATAHAEKRTLAHRLALLQGIWDRMPVTVACGDGVLGCVVGCKLLCRRL